MATQAPDRDPDSDRYRRRQRRRALIGWIGGLLGVAAFVVLVIVGSGESHPRRVFSVPYGETMTSDDYALIEEGEEDAVVLERLGASGRPERLTEPYVLELFPPREEGTACTYWEFSDEPQIFA